MKTRNAAGLACRHCQFYLPEGRRGGNCKRLGAPVQSNWKACTLALPPFAPSWEDIDNMIVWPQHAIQLEAALQKGTLKRAIPPLEAGNRHSLGKRQEAIGKSQIC